MMAQNVGAIGAKNGVEPAVDVGALIDQLRLFLANPDELKDETQREHLKQLSRQVTVELEAPFETVQRLAYSPLPLITSRIAQEHKLFATLVSSTNPLGLEDLASESGLEKRILESILDYLGTQGMVQETEPGRFSATKLTHLLMMPLFHDAITHFHDNCLPAFQAFNTVLNNPLSDLTAFRVGQHSDVDFYTWMETHPVQQGAFHRFMEAQFANLPTWLDAVDVKSQFLDGLDLTEPAFVDVGGGAGHQCQSLQKALPGFKGRVILQDRPEVLEKSLGLDGIEKQSYDFLTQQPVKNARIYYFRQIMHNYTDEKCVEILKAQLSALGPNSVIIIDDKVLPDDKPSSCTAGVEYTAALSLAMKVMFNALERRESHWRKLLARAGLDIKDIRKFTKFNDAIIIATRI